MIAPAVASRKRSFSRLHTAERVSATWLGEAQLHNNHRGALGAGSAANTNDMTSVASSTLPVDSSDWQVPFDTRVDPTITPKSANFVVMEQYFDRQLRKADYSFLDILKDHFTAPEVEQFIPSRDETIVREHTRRTADFQHLLATTFKDKHPTLARKMTMLYFGLPIAPMKMNKSRGPWEEPLAPQDKENDKPDPLRYLEKLRERALMDNQSDNQTSAGMDLRGGNMDAEDLCAIFSDIGERDDEHDDSRSVQWNKEVNDQLTMSLRGGALAYDDLPQHTDAAVLAAHASRGESFMRIYGRQGSVGINATWADFVQGVVHLLELEELQEKSTDSSVRIAIDLFEGPLEHAKTHVMTQEGIFYLNAEKYEEEPNNEVLDFITTNMNKTHYAQSNRRVCFVRFAKEVRPANFRPDQRGCVDIVRRDIAESPVAYMRVSNSPTERNNEFQYNPEWHRAIRTLLPAQKRHCMVDVTLQINGTITRQDAGRVYIDQVFPSALTGLIADHKGPEPFQIVIALDELEDIPILTSPRYRDGPDEDHYGLVCTTPRDRLGEMRTICHDVVEHLTEGRLSPHGRPFAAQDVQYVELYIPSRGFMDQSVRPVRCDYQNGRAVSRDGEWKARIAQFRAENQVEFDAGFGVWARPVYREYTFVDNSSGASGATRHVISNFVDLDLAAFKLELATNLFEGEFDSDDENVVLLLDTSDAGNPENMVVRRGTTEAEWSMMKRMIALNEIGITLSPSHEKYDVEVDTRWDVDPSSYWGPCYSTETDTKASSSTSSATGAPASAGSMGAAPMFRQAFWKTPSIFANHWKPMMTINGGPLEATVQTSYRSPLTTAAEGESSERWRLGGRLDDLRNLALGRTRKCPQRDCGKIFEYENLVAFETHLRQDHLMKDGGGSGSDIKDIPASVLSNTVRGQIMANYKHCNQCGRDNQACHDPRDSNNHDRKCLNLENQIGFDGSATTVAGYCAYCGEASYGTCINAACITKEGPVDPLSEMCCGNCGLGWSGFIEAYREGHRAGCRPLGGTPWQFCGFCGISLATMDFNTRRSHGEVCSRRPKAKMRPCPECSRELETPEESKNHFASDHGAGDRCLWCEQVFPAHDVVWADDVKIQHFAIHMGAIAQVHGVGAGDIVDVNDLRCPGYVDCGVIIGHMSSEQYLNHLDQTHHISMRSGKTHHPNGLPFLTHPHSAQPLRTWEPSAVAPMEHPEGTKVQFKFGSAPRAQSPDWSQSAPFRPFNRNTLFQPRENMRCSRCFTLAPRHHDRNRDTEINLHCSPDYSCHIRRAPGVYDKMTAPVPNRSGWVVFPPGFDFKAARRDFLNTYPSYEGTIFPINEDRVDAVYDDPAQARGQRGDDIYSGLRGDVALVSRQLPWPPHTGVGWYRVGGTENSEWKTLPATGATSARPTHAPKPAKGTPSGKRRAVFKKARVVFPGRNDEDDETSSSSDGEVDPWATGRGTIRRLPMSMRARDPSYRKFSRDEEPEEEVDDRTNQKDGAAENFSMLLPGMKALPADFRSSLEPGFPRKRARTPRNDTTDDERPSKRSRGVRAASRDAAPATDAITTENGREAEAKVNTKIKTKAKATPKAHTKRAVSAATADPATPSGAVAPGGIRKSSRAARSSKKVTYAENVDDGDESPASESPEIAKYEKTPAKRGRKRTDDEVQTTKPAKNPAKTTSKPAVKAVAQTPAKKTRKKANVEEGTPAGEALDDAVEGGKRPRRQPRFK